MEIIKHSTPTQVLHAETVSVLTIVELSGVRGAFPVARPANAKSGLLFVARHDVQGFEDGEPTMHAVGEICEWVIVTGVDTSGCDRNQGIWLDMNGEMTFEHTEGARRIGTVIQVGRADNDADPSRCGAILLAPNTP